MECLDAKVPDLQTLEGYCDLPDNAKLEAQKGGGAVLPIAEEDGPPSPNASRTTTPAAEGTPTTCPSEGDELADDDLSDMAEEATNTQPLPGMEWW